MRHIGTTCREWRWRYLQQDKATADNVRAHQEVGWMSMMPGRGQLKFKGKTDWKSVNNHPFGDEDQF